MAIDTFKEAGVEYSYNQIKYHAGSSQERTIGKLVIVECSPAAVTGDENRKKPLSRNKFGAGRSGE